MMEVTPFGTVEEQDGDTMVKRLSVPIGLEELMSSLTKEVLQKKPKDIYNFASEYFANLLVLRDHGSYQQPSTKIAITYGDNKNVMKSSRTKRLNKQVSIRAVSPTNTMKIKRSATPKHERKKNKNKPLTPSEDQGRGSSELQHVNDKFIPKNSSVEEASVSIKDGRLTVTPPRIVKQVPVSHFDFPMSLVVPELPFAIPDLASATEEKDDAIKHKNPLDLEDEDLSISYNPEALREELQQVQDEVKFNNFKSSYNPYKLRQEIKNASKDVQEANDEDEETPRFKITDEQEDETNEVSENLQHSGDLYESVIITETTAKLSDNVEENDADVNEEQRATSCSSTFQTIGSNEEAQEKQKCGNRESEHSAAPKGILDDKSAEKDTFLGDPSEAPTPLPNLQHSGELHDLVICQEFKQEAAPQNSQEVITPSSLSVLQHSGELHDIVVCQDSTNIEGGNECLLVEVHEKEEMRDVNESVVSNFREAMVEECKTGKVSDFEKGEYPKDEMVDTIIIKRYGEDEKEEGKQENLNEVTNPKQQEREKQAEEEEGKQSKFETLKHFLPDQTLTQAAIKIQSNVRGYLTRKQQKQTSPNIISEDSTLPNSSIKRKVLDEFTPEVQNRTEIFDLTEKFKSPNAWEKSKSVDVLNSNEKFTSKVYKTMSITDSAMSKTFETEDDRTQITTENTVSLDRTEDLGIESENSIVNRAINENKLSKNEDIATSTQTSYSNQYSDEFKEVLMKSEDIKSIEEKLEKEIVQPWEIEGLDLGDSTEGRKPNELPLTEILQHSGELHDTVTIKENELKHPEQHNSDDVTYGLVSPTNAHVALKEELLQHGKEFLDTIIINEEETGISPASPEKVREELQQDLLQHSGELHDIIIMKEKQSKMHQQNDPEESINCNLPTHGVLAKTQEKLEKEGLQHSGELHDTIRLHENESIIHQQYEPEDATNGDPQTSIETMRIYEELNKEALPHSGELHDTIMLTEKIEQEEPNPTEILNELHYTVIPKEIILQEKTLNEEKQEANLQESEQPENKEDVKVEKVLLLQHSGELHDTAISKEIILQEETLNDGNQEVNLRQSEIIIPENKEYVKVVLLQHSGELHDTAIPKEIILREKTLNEEKQEVNLQESEIIIPENEDNVEVDQVVLLQHSGELDATAIPKEIILQEKTLNEEKQEANLQESEQPENKEDVKVEKVLLLQHSGELHDTAISKEIILREETLHDGNQEVNLRQSEIIIPENKEDVKVVLLQHSAELHDTAIPKEIILQEKTLNEEKQEVNLQESEIPENKDVKVEKVLLLQHSGELHDTAISKEIILQEETLNDGNQEVNLRQSEIIIPENKEDVKVVLLQHSGELHDTAIPKEIILREKTLNEEKQEVNLQESEIPENKDVKVEKVLLLQHSGELHDTAISKEIILQEKTLNDGNQEVDLRQSEIIIPENKEDVKVVLLQHSGELHDTAIPKEIILQEKTLNEEKQEVNLQESEIPENKEDVKVEKVLLLQHSGELHDTAISKEIILQEKTLNDGNQEVDLRQSEIIIPENKEDVKVVLLQLSGELHDTAIPKEIILQEKTLNEEKQEVNLQESEIPENKDVKVEKVLLLQHSGEVHDTAMSKEIILQEKTLNDGNQEVNLRQSEIIIPDSKEDVKVVLLQHSGELHDTAIPKEIILQEKTLNEEKQEVNLQESEIPENKDVKVEKVLLLQHSGEVHDTAMSKEIILQEKTLNDGNQEVNLRQSEIIIPDSKEDVKVVLLQHSGELHDTAIPKEIILQEKTLNEEKQEVNLQESEIPENKDVKVEKVLLLQHSGEVHDTAMSKEIILQEKTLNDGNQEVNLRQSEIIIPDSKEDVKVVLLPHSGKLHDTAIPNKEIILQEKTLNEEKEKVNLQESEIPENKDVKVEKVLLLQHSGELLDTAIPKEIILQEKTLNEEKQEVILQEVEIPEHKEDVKVETVEKVEKVLLLQHSGELHDIAIPKEIILQEKTLNEEKQEVNFRESEIIIPENEDNVEVDQVVLLQHSGELDATAIPKEIILQEKTLNEEKHEVNLQEVEIPENKEDVNVKKVVLLQHSGEFHDTAIPKEKALAEKTLNYQSEKEPENIEETEVEKEVLLQHSGELHDIITPAAINKITQNENDKEPAPKDIETTVHKEITKKEEISILKPTTGTNGTNHEEERVCLQHSGELHDIVMGTNDVSSYKLETLHKNDADEVPLIFNEKNQIDLKIANNSTANGDVQDNNNLEKPKQSYPLSENTKDLANGSLQHTGKFHDALIVPSSDPLANEKIDVEQTEKVRVLDKEQHDSMELEKNLKENEPDHEGLYHTGEYHDLMIIENNDDESDNKLEVDARDKKATVEVSKTPLHKDDVTPKSMHKEAMEEVNEENDKNSGIPKQLSANQVQNVELEASDCSGIANVLNQKHELLDKHLELDTTTPKNLQQNGTLDKKPQNVIEANHVQEHVLDILNQHKITEIHGIENENKTTRRAFDISELDAELQEIEKDVDVTAFTEKTIKRTEQFITTVSPTKITGKANKITAEGSKMDNLENGNLINEENVPSKTPAENDKKTVEKHHINGLSLENNIETHVLSYLKTDLLKNTRYSNNLETGLEHESSGDVYESVSTRPAIPEVAPNIISDKNKQIPSDISDKPIDDIKQIVDTKEFHMVDTRNFEINSTFESEIINRDKNRSVDDFNNIRDVNKLDIVLGEKSDQPKTELLLNNGRFDEEIEVEEKSKERPVSAMSATSTDSVATIISNSPRESQVSQILQYKQVIESPESINLDLVETSKTEVQEEALIPKALGVILDQQLAITTPNASKKQSQLENPEYIYIPLKDPNDSSASETQDETTLEINNVVGNVVIEQTVGTKSLVGENYGRTTPEGEIGQNISEASQDLQCSGNNSNSSKNRVESEHPKYIHIPLNDPIKIAPFSKVSGEIIASIPKTSEGTRPERDQKEENLREEETVIKGERLLLTPNQEEKDVQAALGVVADQQLAITTPNASKKESKRQLENPEYIYIPLKDPNDSSASETHQDETTLEINNTVGNAVIEETVETKGFVGEKHGRTIPEGEIGQNISEASQDLQYPGTNQNLSKNGVESEHPQYIHIPLNDPFSNVSGEISASIPKTSKAARQEKGQKEENWKEEETGRLLLSPNHEEKDLQAALGVVAEQQLAITIPNAKEEKYQQNVTSSTPEYIFIPLKDPLVVLNTSESTETQECFPNETTEEDKLKSEIVFRADRDDISAFLHEERKSSLTEDNSKLSHYQDLTQNKSSIGEKDISTEFNSHHDDVRQNKSPRGTEGISVPKALGVVLNQQLAIATPSRQEKRLENKEAKYIHIPLKDPNAPDEEFVDDPELSIETTHPHNFVRLNTKSPFHISDNNDFGEVNSEERKVGAKSTGSNEQLFIETPIHNVKLNDVGNKHEGGIYSSLESNLSETSTNINEFRQNKPNSTTSNEDLLVKTSTSDVQGESVEKNDDERVTSASGRNLGENLTDINELGQNKLASKEELLVKSTTAAVKDEFVEKNDEKQIDSASGCKLGENSRAQNRSTISTSKEESLVKTPTVDAKEGLFGKNDAERVDSASGRKLNESLQQTTPKELLETPTVDVEEGFIEKSDVKRIRSASGGNLSENSTDINNLVRRKSPLTTSKEESLVKTPTIDAKEGLVMKNDAERVDSASGGNSAENSMAISELGPNKSTSPSSKKESLVKTLTIDAKEGLAMKNDAERVDSASGANSAETSMAISELGPNKSTSPSFKKESLVKTPTIDAKEGLVMKNDAERVDSASGANSAENSMAISKLSPNKSTSPSSKKESLVKTPTIDAKEGLVMKNDAERVDSASGANSAETSMTISELGPNKSTSPSSKKESSVKTPTIDAKKGVVMKNDAERVDSASGGNSAENSMAISELGPNKSTSPSSKKESLVKTPTVDAKGGLFGKNEAERVDSASGGNSAENSMAISELSPNKSTSPCSKKESLVKTPTIDAKEGVVMKNDAERADSASGRKLKESLQQTTPNKALLVKTPTVDAKKGLVGENEAERVDSSSGRKLNENLQQTTPKEELLVKTPTADVDEEFKEKSGVKRIVSASGRNSRENSTDINTLGRITSHLTTYKEESLVKTPTIDDKEGLVGKNDAVRVDSASGRKLNGSLQQTTPKEELLVKTPTVDAEGGFIEASDVKRIGSASGRTLGENSTYINDLGHIKLPLTTSKEELFVNPVTIDAKEEVVEKNDAKRVTSASGHNLDKNLTDVKDLAQSKSTLATSKAESLAKTLTVDAKEGVVQKNVEKQIDSSFSPNLDVSSQDVNDLGQNKSTLTACKEILLVKTPTVNAKEAVVEENDEKRIDFAIEHNSGQNYTDLNDLVQSTLTTCKETLLAKTPTTDYKEEFAEKTNEKEMDSASGSNFTQIATDINDFGKKKSTLTTPKKELLVKTANSNVENRFIEKNDEKQIGSAFGRNLSENSTDINNLGENKSTLTTSNLELLAKPRAVGVRERFSEENSGKQINSTSRHNLRDNLSDLNNLDQNKSTVRTPNEELSSDTSTAQVKDGHVTESDEQRVNSSSGPGLNETEGEDVSSKAESMVGSNDIAVQSEGPEIAIQTTQISDNTMPLAVQLNQAPGVEMLTSPTSNDAGDATASIIDVETAGDEKAQAPVKDDSTDDDASKNTSAHLRASMATDKRKNAVIIGEKMEEVAATKIQASFRGYQVRKQLKSKNGGVDSINQRRRSLRRKSSGKLRGAEKATTKSNKASDLEEKSATKIQAGIRGFLVRRRQQKKSKNNASSDSS